METLTFLNSPLLWGLTLASIPVLIHLLYRRRYRRVDWAPMRYLKLSMERNRRRVRIEQLLLLLLRTCIVLLLFFLVARPLIHAEGLSRLLGTNTRTNRVVLLDDSLSMGYAREGRGTLDRAKTVLEDLLGTFGPKDRLTLVLASQPTQPVLREVELEDRDEIIASIREVRPAETLSAWEPILQALDALVASGSYPLHEVTLVTDLRKAGWDSTLTDLGSRWASEHVRLRVFDVGVTQATNVALVSLTQADRLALAGTPTRFEAEIRNDTAAELGGLEANFFIDGKPSLVRVPVMAAGETLKLSLTATLQEPGTHDVALELATDALAGDNRRWTVVEVQKSIDVVLVDGEPSTDPLGSETDFLSLALSLSGEAAESFQVEVMTDAQWAGTPAVQPDLAVLANVARLSLEEVQRLEQLVSDGMGLMVFAGDQLDPDNYNQFLFKAGAGLLPAAWEGISDVEFSGLLVEAVAGSPLEALSELSPAVLQRIKVHKTYELRLPEKSADVHVVARWNNPAAAPAVIEKAFGRGSVLMWTTAADRAWSDWPTEPSYVLAVREAARAIAKSTARLRDFLAGQTLRAAVPASHDVSLQAIELPESQEPKPLVLAGEEAP
ncbi:MAG TPA: BatA domain-containing protein, partial [Pirellulales bacterium]|nr:BatA domain-containing protein [Pirellulales bacterium]